LTAVTYNGDGTGTEVGTAMDIGNAGAVVIEINCELTYVMTSDQSFDVTKQCDDVIKFYLGDVLYTTDFVENGQMQKSGEVIITTTEDPIVQAYYYPASGVASAAICARTGTQIRLD